MRHIGIAAIDDELRTTLLAGKILGKDYGEVGFLTTNHPFRIFWRGDGFDNRKVFRSRQSLYSCPSQMVHLRGHHHRTHIPHVVGDSKAEEQHHHDGHAEEYQHRTLVAQDVFGFLDDE